MARRLKLNLLPQSKIQKEGNLEVQETNISVGKVQTEFFVPEVEVNYSGDVSDGGPQINKLVTRINQYVENIADDYFLLGLHLTALHQLLKQSNLNTDQIKSWYLENINMPYSSAMQCKKVAEVYQDNPSLISRYTASGAYLLSSCESHEEREAIWDEARRGKNEPSIRDLREVLKSRKEAENQKNAAYLPPATPKFVKSEDSIHDSLNELVTHAQQLVEERDDELKVESRKSLIKSIKQLIHDMEEQL